jgi:anti-sigma regulatory factor (Ser/Thr protein kinase)
VNTESTLRVSAELSNLAVIRDFVAERGRALGADLDALYDVVLAVDEAATNVMVHGYRGREGTIEVEVRREGEALVVCLLDQAAPFDPHVVPPPDLCLPLEQRLVGGMGVYMMKQLMDRVIHRVPPQGGNELTLAKNGVFKQLS